MAGKLGRIVASRDYSQRFSGRYGGELAPLSEALDGLLNQVEAQLAVLEQQIHQRSHELERLATEYKHSAFHDALTGLPNQALLGEYFSMITEAPAGEKNGLCLLMLDMDNFKVINDSLGHDFGDDLLKQIGQRIRQAVRRQDMVFRLGGDEFAVVAVGMRSSRDVEAVARQLLAAVRQDFLVRGERIKLTTSIGGALYPEDGSDLISMKRHADMAMYRCKDGGKNGFRMFQRAMQAQALQQLVVQNDLRAAIGNGELIPYFQAKVDAQSRTVIGCEVLARWQHPRQGFLSPADFVPFAEENGLIRDLDRHILEQACICARSWQDRFGYQIPVAVNLSGIHFRDQRIVGIIAKVLQDSGLSPRSLEIELTEAVFIGDPDLALKTLNELKALGIRISLDDFGIGYSSLHYLRTLPVDVVKLDKSFVQNVAVSQHDSRLTQGIIALAKQLGFEVVAEGVETERQMEQLLDLDCNNMQGYHFCRPMPEADFLRWLEEQKNDGFYLALSEMQAAQIGAELTVALPELVK